MTVDPPHEPAGAPSDPVPAVRPFLARGRALTDAPLPAVDPSSTVDVRAYAMTRGRAHAVVHLEFETMLMATTAGRTACGRQRFERRDILERCSEEPVSVAELAAMLRLPIGVVRVLAADLLVDGHLQAYQPSEHVADDVALLSRLIAGVRAL